MEIHDIPFGYFCERLDNRKYIIRISQRHFIFQGILGQKFTQSLLRPIPVTSIASLLQTGYSADFIFRVCVTAINGVFNQSSQRLLMRESDPQFERLITLLTQIQQSGGLGMRITKQEKSEHSVMYFRREMNERLTSSLNELKQLLGLDPDVHEYKLAYGAIAADDKEIAILSRSMLQIMAEVSARVEVPSSHVEENRASPGVFDIYTSPEEARGRIKISCSEDKPEDSFVSIRYRDHWYYIDDQDFRSKRSFSFLMFIFTLVETGSPQKGPELTLST